jgi:glycerate kinase
MVAGGTSEVSDIAGDGAAAGMGVGVVAAEPAVEVG